jgi:CHAT domain-containing protein
MANRKSGMGSTLRGIAECLLLQQKETEAIEYYRRSLKVFEETGEPAELSNTLLAIAKYYLRKKDYPQALEFATRSAKGSKQKSWEANTVLGQVYGALNEPAKARQSFTDAIASIENGRLMVVGSEEEKQRFMEGRVLPYQEMISLLIAAGNTNEAFSLAERSKGRVLLDVLQGDKINLSKTMTAQEQTEQQRLNNELVSVNAQIAAESNRAKPSQERLADLREDLEKARLSYAAFRNQLYIAHPNLKTQRGETQPLTLDEATNLLPDEKTGLLEYVVTPDRTYLFVVRKGAPKASPAELKVYPIEIGQKELEQQVDAYRQKIARADLDFRSSAQALYDLLLKPARAQLKGSTSLVIVPDSVLWDLPFQTLQSSVQRYLIEDQAISYAASLTVLREIIKSHKLPRTSGSPMTLLAFGNPIVSKQTADRVKTVFMDEALEPLPEAERQVTELAKLHGAQARAYTGAQAREDRAKAEAPGFRVLQFATHGVLNSASPMYSHLVLSPSDDAKEDGLLEAWEIMNLDLHADMVVLAACETARGRVGAGEGMIGMSWAFFVAGSPTTVASQWKVESASTTELMLAFHRNLKSHLDAKGTQLSKARALQLASLKLLRSPEYRHPFYWAGFVLVGDGF